MRSFSREALVLVLFVFWGLFSRGLAVDSKETLRGISGFNVVVETLPRIIDRSHTRQETVNNEVEALLRKAGIRVLSESDALSQPMLSGWPYLYVYTDVSPVGKGKYLVYDILVEFRQKVTLVRDPSLTVYASTWSDRKTGWTKKYRLKELQSDITELVEKFAADFVEVNPR